MKFLYFLTTVTLLVFALSSCSLVNEIRDQAIPTISNPQEVAVETLDIANEKEIFKYGGDIDMIANDDLNVVYNGILINGIRSFADIAADLEIVFDATDIYSKGTTEFRVATRVDGIKYYWCIHHYPSADNEDITIEYVFDETSKIVWIVSIDIFGIIETKRGIKAGDREEDMLKVYGGEFEPAYSNEKAYRYYLHPEIDYNYTGITFLVDNDTGLITRIHIDYAHNETFERLDIVELDGADIRD
jgi:hypothetical protein